MILTIQKTLNQEWKEDKKIMKRNQRTIRNAQALIEVARDIIKGEIRYTEIPSQKSDKPLEALILSLACNLIELESWFETQNRTEEVQKSIDYIKEELLLLRLEHF